MRKILVMAMVVVGAMAAVGATTATAPATTQAPRERVLDLGGKVQMTVVRIPAGTFLMGSPETEKDREKNETQHEVTISKAFHMGVTHVTVDQFAAFVKDSGYQTDAEKDGWSICQGIKDGTFDVKRLDGISWRAPGFTQKGDHPVVQVSWNDANAFCEWLSKKSGEKVVLPTEAQWEYACRAGTKTTYAWGEKAEDGKGRANCADQSLKKALPNAREGFPFFSWDDGFIFTSPVGKFRANDFGLYDMTGNAWQWCSDWYGGDGIGEKEAVTDPTGPAKGDHRVLRGGAWNDFTWYCRSAYRHWHHADYRYFTRGFRVVVAGGE